MIPKRGRGRPKTVRRDANGIPAEWHARARQLRRMWASGSWGAETLENVDVGDATPDDERQNGRGNKRGRPRHTALDRHDTIVRACEWHLLHIFYQRQHQGLKRRDRAEYDAQKTTYAKVSPGDWTTPAGRAFVDVARLVSRKKPTRRPASPMTVRDAVRDAKRAIRCDPAAATLFAELSRTAAALPDDVRVSETPHGVLFYRVGDIFREMATKMNF
jgi:hypothetical protein